MKVIQMQRPISDLREAIQKLEIVEKPKPKPGPGQVLIKMEAAPCNPSDLLFLQGKYGVEKPYPAVPGWEGAGRVVENGGGFLGWSLKGKLVACAGQSEGDGTWAEYYLADAKSCIPMPESIPPEQAATFIVNPLTAIGMVERAVRDHHSAIVQTAACSQLGRMVQVLAKQKKIPLLNIVRREEQVKFLQDIGEEWVLNSESPDFQERLNHITHKLQATLALDAVGGEMTGKLFYSMPAKSVVMVYGALSEEACRGISPLGLIFEDKKVEGFWLTKWIGEQTFLHIMQVTRSIQGMMESGAFMTRIRGCYDLVAWKAALLEYSSEMTQGKVILRF